MESEELCAAEAAPALPRDTAPALPPQRSRPGPAARPQAPREANPTGKSGKQERSLHRETDPNRIPLLLPGGGKGPVSRALPHTVCFLL